MTDRTVIIRNENGIHCRPSAVIIKEVQRYSDHSVLLRHGAESCNPSSILGLMSMGLSKGEKITLEVSGPREGEVTALLAELLARNFDFPPLPKT